MSRRLVQSRLGLQTYSCCSEQLFGVRHFSLTPHQQHKDSLSHAWKMNKLNKRIKIVRNDVSGQFRPFFRAGKLYKPSPREYVDPLTMFQSYQHNNVSSASATDDVYVVSQFLPKTYNIHEALEHLRQIATLDFIDSKANIFMKIKHSEILTGKKRKKVLHYKFTKKLPHETNYKNKVCVFTDDEHFRNLALENGAIASGEREVVMQIMQHKLKCDYYLSTEKYFDIISKNTELQNIIGASFPSKRSTVMDDFLPLLDVFVNEANFTNMDSNGTECKIVVGQLDTPVEHLVKNVLFVLENLLDAKTIKKHKEGFLKSVSLSSMTEYIPFDFDALLKSEDIE